MSGTFVLFSSARAAGEWHLRVLACTRRVSGEWHLVASLLVELLVSVTMHSVISDQQQGVNGDLYITGSAADITKQDILLAASRSST